MFAFGADIDIGVVVASGNADYVKLGRWCLLGRKSFIPVVCFGRSLLLEDELTDEAEIVSPASIGEKAVVPNACETRRKNVKQKPPEKLVGG